MVKKTLSLALLLASCSSKKQPAGAPDAATTTTIAATMEADAAPPATKEATSAAPPSSQPQDVVAYIRAKLPKNGSVEPGDPPKITHKMQGGDNAQSVATAYFELTEFYKVEDLAASIIKKNPAMAPGATIEIPRPLHKALRTPKEDKLGWPEDKILKGIFITGPHASIKWTEVVDKTEEHGLNAIVLDAKDYDGYVNYPSKAKIAVESGAIRDKNIPDLTRAIRYAHWHNVHIILRVPCFHDPWADKHTPDSRLSLKYTPTGKPMHVDWIDPTNPEAQEYAIEIAKEGIEAGADEIQLDYVRFPVHLSHKVAVLPPREDRPNIIKTFVKRVHEIVQKEGVFLSLDFFGVAATGERDDILALGQDIATVAPEADAISLMSYPSHYGKHYMGYANAADHVEIIGQSNKAALAQLKPTGAKTIFRTWLQAFPSGVTHYGSAYLLGQAKSAETSGGHGWLMWSPSCEYGPVWSGWPSVTKK